jgi:tRNA(His) guanylyltransferase
VDADMFEAGQRSREYFHAQTVLPGAWTIIRVDGRGFSKLTEQHFDKPFDARFGDMMATTAETLLRDMGGRYAYTESDEISLLLDPDFALFGRGVEKLVSVSAGIASAALTHVAGMRVHFDSRLWLGTGVGDVVDYFSWRQADAARSALNNWCYWTLRRLGRTRAEATDALDSATTSSKNELLFAEGINFNEVPAWQRRGIGLWWEAYERTGHDPVRGVDVTTTRRRVNVDRELPMKDEYRALVERIATNRQ